LFMVMWFIVFGSFELSKLVIICYSLLSTFIFYVERGDYVELNNRINLKHYSI